MTAAKWILFSLCLASIPALANNTYSNAPEAIHSATPDTNSTDTNYPNTDSKDKNRALTGSTGSVNNEDMGSSGNSSARKSATYSKRHSKKNKRKHTTIH